MNIAANHTVLIHRADDTHGNTLAAYRKVGSPQYPTVAQVEEINRQGELPPPQATRLKDSQLELKLPVNGVAVIELQR
jgi:xylan 1,4-beta-xylosidase